MPRKKLGARKKGGKRKVKKGTKTPEENAKALYKCQTDFLKAYRRHCALFGTTPSQALLSLIKEGIKDEKPPVKFILEPSLVHPTLPKAKLANPAQPISSTQNTQLHTPLPATSPSPIVLLQPLVNSWVETKYSYAQYLHVWSTNLTDDAIVSLALYFESPIGITLKVLELQETNLSPWSIDRLARSLHKTQLSVLNLDYNRIPQLNLAKLCEGLQKCLSLRTLSLNYCHLDANCGETLGTYTVTSTVRELSLIGNSLECGGCIELVKPVVALSAPDTVLDQAPTHTDQAPTHTTQTDPSSASSEKSELASESTKVEEDRKLQPLSFQLAKLYLQDNCIDMYGESVLDGSFEPVVCARILKRLMMCSPSLEEINLAGNQIGDGGGRELMLGLQMRKEMGLPSLKLTVTNRISTDIFSTILELSKTSKLKKKGKKKKKRR